MIELLNSIVKQMLDQHGGGEIFFDNLDAALQERPIVDSLLSLVGDHLHYHYLNIIISGKFGRFLLNYYNSSDYTGPEFANIILVNGGIRTTYMVDDLSYLLDTIAGDNYIFVDDSFYSGKTRDVIKMEIERQGGHLTHTYTIYDGSHIKDPGVTSLFRYYK